jgi:D-alanyl-lipoteichoic acid acyltransferase DltB (MBOAT superfamily)
MLFNSYGFVFFFLPLICLLFTAANRVWGVHVALLTLIGASLAFYAAWNPWFLLLLGGSVAGNFSAGRTIGAALGRGRSHWASVTLGAAVVANLAVLAWFKYAGFFAATANGLLGSAFPIVAQVLPLAACRS